ncbi:GNAT family N-acetyltransferase [Algicella marina]|uniref:GNAT family N-acetyltransferase n=1 Tax=Algicella marina TaxID=2683284 RepID=A0A6P1SZ50_9RHOB|nr:GNAT family N-acetyltransferase [Algicella marina]QHQ35748.1 GNAT family N-acetyltransferase [Algicella marina]
MSTTFTIPTIETDRVILRAPKESDIADETSFFASDESRFVGGPMTAELTWRAIASVLGHWALRGYGFWALEERSTGAYLGRSGLWKPEGWPEEEIGWTLMPHARGRGFATEAGRRAREYAYQILGWKTAISLIDPSNAASIAVARRLGAKQETTFEHERHGLMQIWRHPAPEELA